MFKAIAFLALLALSGEIGAGPGASAGVILGQQHQRRAAPMPNPAEQSFARGVAEYQNRRYSAAWGQFYNAANAGDPDAARVALHMLRYGPILYGSHWDANQDEIEFWEILARKKEGRAMPPFKPKLYQQGDRYHGPTPKLVVRSDKPRPFNEVPAVVRQVQ